MSFRWLLFSQVDAPGIYELGWVLRRDCWGKGLAGEASLSQQAIPINVLPRAVPALGVAALHPL